MSRPDYKQLYEQQLEENNMLREMDHLLRQFLAGVYDSSREPLACIINSSQRLLEQTDDPLTDQQEHSIEAIYNSGQDLSLVLEGICDILPSKAHKFELNLSPINLNNLIAKTMEIAQRLLKDRPQLKVQQSIPVDLPTVMVDELRIRQVLLNLLINAIRFTEKGFVRVSAWSEKGRVVFSVEDTGIGIPYDRQQDIRKQFLDEARNRFSESSGKNSGLMISQFFVMAHGGEIWFESEVGAGTTFYFSLPLFEFDYSEPEKVMKGDRRTPDPPSR